MKPFNDRRSPRILIDYVKLVLRENSSLLKQDCNIQIPSDIFHMEQENLYTFITKDVYPIITEHGSNIPQINFIISELSKFISMYQHYYGEPKEQTI